MIDQQRSLPGIQPWPTALPPPRKRGTVGTRQAAREAIFAQAGRIQARIYRFLLDQGDRGASDAEVQAALGIDGNTERPRRIALQRAGLVRDSGRTRPTSSGRHAVVWICSNGSSS